jgi:hypothetical protein
MRMFIMIMAFTMCSCATKPPQSACPDVPSIGDQETLKDYTLHVINMYKECQTLQKEKS